MGTKVKKTKLTKSWLAYVLHTLLPKAITTSSIKHLFYNQTQKYIHEHAGS